MSGPALLFLFRWTGEGKAGGGRKWWLQHLICKWGGGRVEYANARPSGRLNCVDEKWPPCKWSRKKIGGASVDFFAFFLLVGKTNPPPPPPPTNCRHYELICKCVLKKREQKRNTRSVLDRWTKNTNKKRHRLLWRMPSNGVEFYGCDDRRRWLIDRATYMQLY